MLKKRVIPVLLSKDGVIVRSRKFSLHQTTGNYLEQVKRYIEWGADEIIYIDISRKNESYFSDNYQTIGSRTSGAKIENISSFEDIVKIIAKNCDVPLTIGGRIEKIDDAENLLKIGADKIMINSLLHKNIPEVQSIIYKYGSQCVVAGIDVKRIGNDWRVFHSFGKIDSGLSINECISLLENIKVGELLIQSIDRDGSGKGFDLDLAKRVNNLTNLPIIFLGGAGRENDFLDLVDANNETALAAANFFHFSELSIYKLKKYLSFNNVNVRII